MEIKITPAAVEALKEKMGQNPEKAGVRIYVAGMGWGGPTFGMTLDESKDTDSVFDIEGIKVLFDRETARYTKGFEIDFRNSIFGKRFSINQLYGGGSCH